MIGWLQGKFIAEITGGMLLDVNGVGYQVFCSSRTLSNIGRDGSLLALFIETHVREDHIHLYGFVDKEEQSLFKTLLSVQGVGAKVALAMLSALKQADIRQAIITGDKAMLNQAEGVGPKLANRIIQELKDKIDFADSMLVQHGHITGNINEDSTTYSTAQAGALGGIQQDALSALVNLGYKRQEAMQAIAKVIKAHDEETPPDLGLLIQSALRLLA